MRCFFIDLLHKFLIKYIILCGCEVEKYRKSRLYENLCKALESDRVFVKQRSLSEKSKSCKKIRQTLSYHCEASWENSQ